MELCSAISSVSYYTTTSVTIRALCTSRPSSTSVPRRISFLLSSTSSSSVISREIRHNGGERSRYEIAKLQEVAKRYEDHDEWDLSQHTHDFPEWQKNAAGKSCRPIPLEDIRRAVGLEDAAAAIQEEARDSAFFDRAFGR